ncbi:MAG: PilW family protein [Acidobacteriaceae bacterium]
MNAKAKPIAVVWRAREAGLTLIELMIAITLSLIIVGAVISLYITSQHLYRVQDNLSRLQESARYAMNTMARDLRMAGYEGCLTGHTPVHNDLNNTTGYQYNFSTPLEGYQFVSGSWVPTLDPVFTATLTPASPPGGVFTLDTASDIVTVRLADPSQMLAVTQPSSTSATLLVSLAGGTNPFYSGEILLVTNCSGADIFQVTAQPQPTSVSVTHNGGNSVSPGNVQAALSQNYGSDGEVMPMSTVTYFVGTYQAPGATTPDPPTLWRVDTTNIPPGSTQPLPMAVASDVKQMTIYYGEDTDGDGAANEYVTAQQIQSIDPSMAHVVSVRVVLLFETGDDYLSRVPQTIQNYPIPGAPSPATFVATDHRLYRVFTMTVALRNRAL